MTHIEKTRKYMREKGVDGLIVSSDLNRRYLSGFNYTDGYAFVTDKKAFLLADFRYIEAARATVSEDEFEVLMPSGGMLACVASLAEDCRVKNIAFEEDEVSVALEARFEKMFQNFTLTPVGSEILTSARITKDKNEIEKIKAAQAITDAGFAHMLEVLTPDMTEIEAALELEFFMRRMGSEGTAFETIAVSGSASSLPHGVPRNKKLEKGFFTMDFGAKYDGYCSDMTRTVVVGHADDKMKHLYNTVLEAQTAALDKLHAGMNGKEADSIARDIINNAGYEGRFGHSLGHGVGMFIHESPRLSQSAESNILCPGHVVTVEPGIYLEGLYGCRIEDMVCVLQDGGIYNFTKSPKDLIELFV